jgi:uncharacterized protein YecT (DUF1311 family)
MIMKNILHLILMVAALLPLTSRAAGNTACEQRSNIENRDCAEQALVKANRSLNAAYAVLTRRIKDEADFTGSTPGDVQTELRQAQRAWLRFRSEECSFSGSLLNGGTGTIGPLITMKCMLEMTNRRTRELKTYKDELTANDTVQ